MDFRISLIEVFSRAQAHHDFFQRRVSGPLADAVDRALDLPCPFHHRRQTVRDRETQIVVAVDGDYRPSTIGHMLLDTPDELPEFLRDRVTHRIGNVHRSGSGRNHRLDHFIEIGRIGPAGIHRRELHIIDIASRQLHHLDRPLLGLLARHPELMLQMDVRRRKKRMDADFRRAFQGFPGAGDVLRTGPGQTADRRPFDLLGDPMHRLKVAGRAVGESRLDDVHAEPRQLFRHHDLLFHVHTRTGGLLPVAQRRIEYSDHACHGVTSLLPLETQKPSLPI